MLLAGGAAEWIPSVQNVRVTKRSKEKAKLTLQRLDAPG
jgi:hypothetical protein